MTPEWMDAPDWDADHALPATNAAQMACPNCGDRACVNASCEIAALRAALERAANQIGFLRGELRSAWEGKLWDLSMHNILQCADETAKQAHEALDGTPAALERTRWIPVGERLPAVNHNSYSTSVLAFSDYRAAGFPDGGSSIDKARVTPAGWQDNAGHELDCVTHWQPLPEPPQA